MERADLLIRGCTILPMNDRPLIDDGAIAVTDSRITFVGKRSKATNTKADYTVDARRKLALPGLINCHTHLPMTLFRGAAEDMPLEDWLRKVIWPLESKLTPHDVYAGSLLGCLEMIKNGITCFADMYSHENMVAKAVGESGLRAVLAEGIIEAGNRALGRKTFNSSINFAKDFNGYATGRVTTMLGSHAAYSCGSALLQKIGKGAKDMKVGIHTHLAESKAALGDLREEHAPTEVEYLDGIGLLGNRVLAAHCINLSKSDIQTIAKRRVNMVHVPVGNMKLGLGTAKVNELRGSGINVCLGTDGPASNNTLDMFETMKTAALLQKNDCLDPTVLPAQEILKMAITNGAKALDLDACVGSIEQGKKADIILVDLDKPHLKPLHNVVTNLVYSVRGSDVDTVIADGEVLMENRQVKTLDELAVMERAEKAAIALFSR